jgi:hypothetical protein
MTDRRMAKFKNHAVIAQWPELAVIGMIPDATNRKPPKATTTRIPAILKIQRFAL